MYIDTRQTDLFNVFESRSFLIIIHLSRRVVYIRNMQCLNWKIRIGGGRKTVKKMCVPGNVN